MVMGAPSDLREGGGGGGWQFFCVGVFLEALVNADK